MNRKFIIIMLFILCIIFVILGLTGLNYEKPVVNEPHVPIETDDKSDIEKIQEYFLLTNSYQILSVDYDLKFKTSDDKIELEYRNKKNHNETGKFDFEYLAGIISSVYKGSDMILGRGVYESMIEAVAHFYGYEFIDAYYRRELIDYKTSTIEKEGIKFDEKVNRIDFAITFDKKIFLPELSLSTFMMKDFVNYGDVIKDNTKSMSMTKGNMIFSSENSVFYFYEYNDNTSITLNSIVNFVEFYFGDIEFKNIYTELEEYNNDIIKIYKKEKLNNDEVIVGVGSSASNYSLVKVELLIKED